jgi:8-oxo-dGTP pyrophosphatase MutT (NUDIX family)
MEQFRPGVALFILNENDEILILQRKSEKPDNGKWCLPGGGLERGEEIFDAFVRETLEETGIDLTLEKESILKYDVDTCYYPAPYDSYHLTVYGVYKSKDDSIFDTLQNLEPEKHYQLAWVSLFDFCTFSSDAVAFYDVIRIAQDLHSDLEELYADEYAQNDCGCDCEDCEIIRNELGLCDCDGDDCFNEESNEEEEELVNNLYAVNIDGVDHVLNLEINELFDKFLSINVNGEGHVLNITFN